MAGINLIYAGKDLIPYFRKQVKKALLNQKVDVTEVSEFYIVNMLNEFSKTDTLYDWKTDHYEEKPLAILLKDALLSGLTEKIKLFKRLGDISLYFSGYFSDHIDSKMVDIDYYISMGEGAYQNLSGILLYQKTFNTLYEELSEKFVDFVGVLSEVSRASDVATNAELVRLYEKWLRTGDTAIKELLEKEGILTA